MHYRFARFLLLTATAIAQVMVEDTRRPIASGNAYSRDAIDFNHDGNPDLSWIPSLTCSLLGGP